MKFKRLPAFFPMMAFLLTLIISGCATKAPVPIDPKTEWLDFSDQRAGYSIQYPAKYRLVPGGNGEVGFKGPDTKIAYRICHVSMEEAKKRGLWVTSDPVGTTYVSGGFTSHKYVYDHRDGPVYSRTVAFVLDREGKMLALEFRVDSGNEEGRLDEGQEMVLKSWTML